MNKKTIETEICSDCKSPNWRNLSYLEKENPHGVCDDCGSNSSEYAELEINKSNWWRQEFKEEEDYEEAFKKYDPEGYERRCHDEHLSDLAFAKMEREAFRNYYETNDEHREEMEREDRMYRW